MSVTPSAAAPNGFLVNSFARDDPLVCLDYVRAKLGLPAFTPQNAPARASGGRGGSSGRYKDTRAPAKPLRPPPDNRKLALWREAVDAPGSLVEAYLEARRLELPLEAANEAIRFHPDCPFGGDRFPAMVCLVRNIVTNEPQGVLRTAIAVGGTAIKRNGKTFRLSLGSISGGAIKIDPDEDVTHGLCIGEGVETCLAGRQMGLRPVWSAVNIGGVAKFPVAPGVDGLHIFKENDAGGQSAEAVEACARRWYGAGRDVIIVEPDTAKDLNDELQEAAPMPRLKVPRLPQSTAGRSQLRSRMAQVVEVDCRKVAGRENAGRVRPRPQDLSRAFLRRLESANRRSNRTDGAF